MPDPVLLNPGDVTFTAQPGTTIHITVSDPPPPPPPPPPPVDPNAMPVGDLPGWKQVFTEDFTTPSPIGHFAKDYAARWFCYADGWKDTTGHGTYMPSRVLSAHDSLLDMWIHTEGTTHMVATVCPLLQPPTRAGQLYGRHSIRFKVLDPIVGYKGVPLLWPDQPQAQKLWSPCGEIDFPEASFNRPICAYTHHADATSGSDQEAFKTTVQMAGAWHTATVEWLPNSLTYILDGNVVGHSTVRVPSVSAHLDLQFETSTDNQTPNALDATHVLVDWVCIWRYDPTST